MKQAAAILLCMLIACAGDPSPTGVPQAQRAATAKVSVATLGAGCFWCIEAVLEQVDGVLSVESGFMGGHVDNPTYQQICTGQTGHAEVVQVTFDPGRITYPDLLVWFWKLHDPTTRDRQGPDRGPQYRSVIFHHSEAQREAAEKSRNKADASGVFPARIVTEITSAATFYPADQPHQDYYRNNRNERYCKFLIAPKLEKLGLDR